jgi:hypothetical protein
MHKKFEKLAVKMQDKVFEKIVPSAKNTGESFFAEILPVAMRKTKKTTKNKLWGLYGYSARSRGCFENNLYANRFIS